MANKNSKIINSKDLLMVSLSKFYNNKTNINKILPIINGDANNKVSLRLIDWFVTNYSKKHNVIINRTSHFNVYLSYRSQLKAYSKQLFDPFRRRDRITFVYDTDKSIETTIGQLNMFRWILQNDILDYINKHLEDIESDMLTVQRLNQNKKNDEENVRVKVLETNDGIIYQRRKKRNQLSKSTMKNMNMFATRRVVEFD